tara:strand:+ start:2112 stop:2342 length:231 start_codon:yes stop_codon:yes gene_type:complete
MINQPLVITDKEFHDYMEFCIDLCNRNNVVFRIQREDGTAVMCVPVKQESVIPNDVQEQVEEFQKQFLDNLDPDPV